MSLVALLLSIGVRPSLALANDRDGKPIYAKNDPGSHASESGFASGSASGSASESESGGERPDRSAAPAETTPVPQLQLQDEGPPAPTRDAARLSTHARPSADEDADDAEARPFWKSWIFWAVTGALVAGAVGLTVYSASHSTSSSLAACPADVAVSLGCFGAGRGR